MTFRAALFARKYKVMAAAAAASFMALAAPAQAGQMSAGYCSGEAVIPVTNGQPSVHITEASGWTGPFRVPYVGASDSRQFRWMCRPAAPKPDMSCNANGKIAPCFAKTAAPAAPPAFARLSQCPNGENYMRARIVAGQLQFDCMARDHRK